METSIGPAPRCPECGGARFWYGNIEFWIGGSSRSGRDNFDAAVCSTCGYSSFYLHNMPKFRQDLTKLGFSLGPAGINPVAGTSQEQPEIKAIREAFLSGDKVKAIKLYRNLYGGSQQEAQNALDTLYENRHG